MNSVPGWRKGPRREGSLAVGFLPSAFGGGAFGAAAREVKDDFFFLIIFLVGILCEVDRAPFISFLCSPRDVIIFSLFKLITHTI